MRRKFVTSDWNHYTIYNKPCQWIVQRGSDLVVIDVDRPDGTYDEEGVYLLPGDGPWHTVARRMLKLGGKGVHFPLDTDRGVAEALLRPSVRTRNDQGVIYRPMAGMFCLGNAIRLGQEIPGAHLHVGMALQRHINLFNASGWLSIEGSNLPKAGQPHIPLLCHARRTYIQTNGTPSAYYGLDLDLEPDGVDLVSRWVDTMKGPLFNGEGR